MALTATTTLHGVAAHETSSKRQLLIKQTGGTEEEPVGSTPRNIFGDCVSPLQGSRGCEAGLAIYNDGIFDDIDWVDLSRKDQKKWGVIGFTEELWNNPEGIGLEPPAVCLRWKELK